MNKILIGSFKTEVDAYNGLDALKKLHEQGDITLWASAVLVKSTDGTADIKYTDAIGPVGTVLGTVTGATVGLLGGPAGVAVGASAGSLTGLMVDLANSGIDMDFLEDISKELTAGEAFVLAEIDEDWVTPVDAAFEKAGGVAVRRPRSEVIEDQLARNSEALNREIKEIREELKADKEEKKAQAKKSLQSLQEKVKSLDEKAKESIHQINEEAKAKVEKLKTQMTNARNEQKKKLETRIDEIKTDHVVRSEKLRQARELTREALTT